MLCVCVKLYESQKNKGSLNTIQETLQPKKDNFWMK